ncbi:hypothetical protein [Pseudoroseicyclus tamaricis]|uniref:APC family permease n=1 Tax=Pseudoroseicyclus tamaricis TaxID=2705421 RepID=A0A6B2JZ17_9RHOB|nr:hypothetical protein [Pseudoroseicyclus tamaricis]NDV01859.1 hypothetical protein [Pseudoroseicyclus tamaricis]
METALILLAVLLAGALLAWPKVFRNPLWRATVTPLASIIGSGFLILGPVLNAEYGAWAPAVMAALCALAWAFGAAIRANIASIEAAAARPRAALALERTSQWVLAFAYAIAVAYYLNLFGAFAVELTPWNGELTARLVTSGVFLVILATGWLKGFSALERMEQVAVGLKLAIIAGLLTGLAWAFAADATGEGLYLNPVTIRGPEALFLAFGLLVTVQGFETSRYLGEEYSARQRIRSMRLAQALSTLIYLVYIGLFSYLFAPHVAQVDEAAIIGMMRQVALILPPLLVVAALAAQFSAAVADTSGAGGLVEELTGGRIGPRAAYAVLVAAGLVLTWWLDVFVIITWASRAFALYYALQAAIAAVEARRAGQRGWMMAWGALCLLGLAITALGTPVE